MTEFNKGDRVNFRGNDPATPGTVVLVTEDPPMVTVRWDDGFSEEGEDGYMTVFPRELEHLKEEA